MDLAMRQAPPPQQGMSPQQYFMSLYQQGYSPSDAYSAVQQNYGPPKSPQQQRQDQASQQRNGQLAATGGMIAGLVGSKLAYDWASGLWKDTKTGEVIPKETVTQAFNAEGIPYSQSGTLTITRPVPPPTTVVDGSQSGTLNLSGDTTVIDTAAGPQEVPVEAANDQEFLKTVDWGAAAQAGLGAAQVYGAYRAYKSGDKVGAGIIGTTGAANMYAGGAQLAAGQGASYAGSEMLSQVLPGLNIAAGAYGGYKTADYISDAAAGSERNRNSAIAGAASGASIGAGVDMYTGGATMGLGTVIGAVVGGLAGAVGSWTGSHKAADQQQRDHVRSVLQENNILDKDWMGTLADGTKFDFGKDGDFLKWRTIDKIAEERPKEWDQAVRFGHVISASYGLSGQSLSDMTKWWGRAAIANSAGDLNVVKNNMQHFAQQQGLTYDQLVANVNKNLADNQISQAQADQYLKDGQELFNINTQPASTQKQAMIPIRPPEGEALRVSPGLYRIDTGELLKAKTLRDALDQAYKQTTKPPQQPEL